MRFHGINLNSLKIKLISKSPDQKLVRVKRGRCNALGRVSDSILRLLSLSRFRSGTGRHDNSRNGNTYCGRQLLYKRVIRDQDVVPYNFEVKPMNCLMAQGKYRLGRKIGSGSFGDIYLGESKVY